MKSLIVFVTSLLQLASGQFTCCYQSLDYQTYITLYLGLANTNIIPEAFVGTARRISLSNQRLEMTEYLDWRIPGLENVRYIISDARQNPTTVYTVNRDGSCSSERFSNLPITPPCVPSSWSYKETMQLGNAVWDRYGDDFSKNYLMVERSTCQPVMQLATRRNQPTQGLYRFNTEYYYNTTSYFGTINIPQSCNQQQQTVATTRQPVGGINTVRRPDFNTRQPGGTTRQVINGGPAPAPAPGVTQRYGPPASGPAGPTRRPDFGAPNDATSRVSNEGSTRSQNNIPENSFTTPPQINK